MAKTKAPAAKKLRRKAGKYKPTEEESNLVAVGIAGGIEHKFLWAALGISERTFRNHFKKEIESGGARANGQVIAKLFGSATGTNNQPYVFQAAMFWLKCRAGWKEQHEIGGPGGGPIIVKFSDREAKV